MTHSTHCDKTTRRNGRQPLQTLCAGLALLVASQTASAVTVLLDEDFEQVTGLTASTSRAVKDILSSTPDQLSAGLTIGEPISSAGFISVRSADNGLNSNPFNSFNGFFSSNFLAMNVETGYDRTTNSAFGLTQLTIPVAPLASMSAGNFIRFSFDYILDGAIQAGSNQSFLAVLTDDDPATPPPGDRLVLLDHLARSGALSRRRCLRSFRGHLRPDRFQLPANEDLSVAIRWSGIVGLALGRWF